MKQTQLHDLGSYIYLQNLFQAIPTFTMSVLRLKSLTEASPDVMGCSLVSTLKMEVFPAPLRPLMSYSDVITTFSMVAQAPHPSCSGD